MATATRISATSVYALKCCSAAFGHGSIGTPNHKSSSSRSA
jgi:hypothetical protein